MGLDDSGPGASADLHQVARSYRRLLRSGGGKHQVNGPLQPRALDYAQQCAISHEGGVERDDGRGLRALSVSDQPCQPVEALLEPACQRVEVIGFAVPVIEARQRRHMGAVDEHEAHRIEPR